MNKTRADGVRGAECVTPEEIEQARSALRAVCSLALTAVNVSRDPPTDEDMDTLYGRVRVLQVLVDRIGWVADVGLRKLGDQGTFAGAEDWMLQEV